MRPSALALGKGDSASQSLPRVCQRNANTKHVKALHVDVATPLFWVSLSFVSGCLKPISFPCDIYFGTYGIIVCDLGYNVNIKRRLIWVL